MPAVWGDDDFIQGLDVTRIPHRDLDRLELTPPEPDAGAVLLDTMRRYQEVFVKNAIAYVHARSVPQGPTFPSLDDDGFLVVTTQET